MSSFLSASKQALQFMHTIISDSTQFNDMLLKIAWRKLDRADKYGTEQTKGVQNTNFSVNSVGRIALSHLSSQEFIGRFAKVTIDVIENSMGNIFYFRQTINYSLAFCVYLLRITISIIGHVE